GVGWWDGRSADDFTVVASAELTSLTTDAPAGEAHVEAREGGERVLVLDTDLPSERSGDLEVWLIDPSVTGMVSLGFLESSHGEFVIPQGYSISAYPIVDISVEPRDGVPTHSGDSITRGTLGA
ncbi:MAG: anti-sigma factor, partial [Demequinaceae bacterium]|nr:anti-sigma factor [Demequinaceae bacterium]